MTNTLSSNQKIKNIYYEPALQYPSNNNYINRLFTSNKIIIG